MITSHRNKTHTYYCKDSNKLGARKFRLIMYNNEDMVFRNGIYVAIHTPLVYIYSQMKDMVNE